MARPTFKPTATQRRDVAAAAGAGMSHEDIAIGLGISRNTLEKHFTDELGKGAAKKRLEVISAMFKAAKGGNVTAQRAYLAMQPKFDPPPADPEEKAAGKVGKKEQANADAKTAAVGTDWADLLPGARLQ